MGILVVNAGSSNLKVTLFDDEVSTTLATASAEWAEPGGHTKVEPADGTKLDRPVSSDAVDHHATARHLIRSILDAHPSLSIRGIGHRVVHGGPSFGQSVILTDAIRSEIMKLGELAPLHNPFAVEAMEVTTEILPGVPEVAVFDTGFFRQLPTAAVVFPLPYSWYADWGYQRFGFHGISHGYCAKRAAELLGRNINELRLISLHLGNGCSATAVKGGVAVETTMGFTPMDGLTMGSRAGAVDPGVLIHALRQRGLGVEELDRVLNRESGLKGVSGVSSDYREVARAASENDPRAQLALEIYARRVRSAVGSLAVTMGGVDVLIFTAGVGENQPGLRSLVCHGLECLGVNLDENLNTSSHPDADIATANSRRRILIVHSQEDLVIARQTRELLEAGS